MLDRAHTIAREKLSELNIKIKLIETKKTFTQSDLLSVTNHLNTCVIKHEDFKEERLKEVLKNSVVLEKLEFEIESIKDNISKGIDPVKLNNAITLIQNKLNGLKNQKNLEEALKNEVTKTNHEIQNLVKNILLLEDSIKFLKKDFANIANEVGLPCSECGTPITVKHLEPKKESIQNKIKQKLDQISLFTVRLNTYREDHKKAVEALEKFQLTMFDPSTLTAQHTKLTAMLQDRDKVYEQLNRFQNEKKAHIDKHEELSKKENPFTDMVTTTLTLQASLQASLDKTEQEFDALEKQKKLILNVIEVYGPGGVRALMLDNVTPYLNERTSKYLTILSDGEINATWNTLTKNAKGEYKEHFEIKVTKTDGGGFDELSGGEKRKVRIACAMALTDLVSSRATKNIEFVAFDEVDTALDKAGLERLMMVFEEKVKEKGTVIVISHSDLSSFISNIWTVTKQDGKSTLEANLKVT